MNNIEKDNYFENTENLEHTKSIIRDTLRNLCKFLWINMDKTPTNPYRVKNPREIPPRNVYLSNNRVVSMKKVNKYINSI